MTCVALPHRHGTIMNMNNIFGDPKWLGVTFHKYKTDTVVSQYENLFAECNITLQWSSKPKWLARNYWCYLEKKKVSLVVDKTKQSTGSIPSPSIKLSHSKAPLVSGPESRQPDAKPTSAVNTPSDWIINWPLNHSLINLLLINLLTDVIRTRVIKTFSPRNHSNLAVEMFIFNIVQTTDFKTNFVTTGLTSNEPKVHLPDLLLKSNS